MEYLAVPFTEMAGFLIVGGVFCLGGFFCFVLLFFGFFKEAFLGRQIKHACTFKWISQPVA